ncbi:MAG TPA: AI-2E family transporter YdiK [Gallionella sp.]|nr:AI-2E family transporter YdiK [Gallionella sp.]
MNMTRRDLAGITLGVLSIGALIIASLWVLKPFLFATVWATMVVVATWPVLLWVQARLWNSRALAVIVMTLFMLLLFMVPVALAVGTIVENSDQIVEWAKSIADFQIPPPPHWVAGLPFVGGKAAAAWQQAADSGGKDLMEKLAPHAGAITKWATSKFGSIGKLFVHFVLIVILAAVMYAGGEAAAAAVKRFARRLAGERGESTVELAGQAIRGVALGVGVTALVQSALGGIGLAIAGIPFASLLTALMFMLCIAQLGPGLVLIPAVVWVYWSGDTAWGTFLLVWSVIVVTLDNFLRPMLIKMGADLPLLLIFAGVIGGLLSFGLVGIFVGPVVLAVAYKLLGEWISDENAPVADEQA